MLVFLRVMQCATDAFYIFDENLYLVDANPAALSMLNIDKEEASGEHMLELAPHVEKTGRYIAYKKVIKTGEPYDTFDTVDEPKWKKMYMHIKAFKVEDGLGVVTTDLTELKQTQDALKETQKILHNNSNTNHENR